MSRTVRMKEKEVRVLLQRAAKLRDSLTQEQERLLGREPEYGGNTTIAVYDPNRLLEAFPSLRLRPGFKLASYQYLSGGNGNGFTFAIPADRHLPTPPSMNSNHNRWPMAEPDDPVFDQAQALLKWASPEVNRFLVGDGSPRSFFEASILEREVHELGAIWHGCSWAARSILTGREGFPGTDWLSGLDDPEWNWRRKRPKIWSPSVTIPNKSPKPLTVRFNLFSGLGSEHIVSVQDKYPNWNSTTEPYVFDTDSKLLAEGRPGLIF